MKLCQNAHSMHYVCLADLQHLYIHVIHTGNSCLINTMCSSEQNEGILSLLTNVSVLLTLDLLFYNKLSYAWKPNAVIIHTFRSYRT